MNNQFANVCIRCGQHRVISRTWKEKAGNSTVTTTEMMCPTPECQKEVDRDNKRQRDRSAALKLKSEQRMLQRKAVLDAKREEKLSALSKKK